MSDLDSEFSDLSPTKEHNITYPKGSMTKKSKEYIEYARSRLKYISNLTLTNSSIVFTLDSSNIKTGIVNRSTQYQINGFSTEIQTETLFHNSCGCQIPDSEIQGNRFPTMIHFLKAASQTISSLVEKSEFSIPIGPNQALAKINSFITKNTPIQVEITSKKTYALIETPILEGQIMIWNGKLPDPTYFLQTSSLITKFCLFNEGNIIIGGSSSGSIVIWNIQKLGKETEKSGTICHEFSTENLISKNHQSQIIGISSFGRRGMNVVCALDSSSIASFWYIRFDNDKVFLKKAETVNLSANYFPAFSLAVPNNSVDSFLVGCGGRIWNCSRFGTHNSPPTYNGSSSFRTIVFSPIIPSIFLAGSDNGRVSLFSVDEQDPLIEFSIDLSTSDLDICWSPTRATVFFVAANASMRVFIFDMSIDLRKPVYSHKVGSASRCISTSESINGVILAIGDGSNSVTILRVKNELSKQLSDDEIERFKLNLYNFAK